MNDHHKKLIAEVESHYGVSSGVLWGADTREHRLIAIRAACLHRCRHESVPGGPVSFAEFSAYTTGHGHSSHINRYHAFRLALLEHMLGIANDRHESYRSVVVEYAKTWPHTLPAIPGRRST